VSPPNDKRRPRQEAAQPTTTTTVPILDEPTDEDHDLFGLELLAMQACQSGKRFPKDHSQDLLRARAVAAVDRAIKECGCRFCVASIEDINNHAIVAGFRDVA
jgi:hypothetical protein